MSEEGVGRRVDDVVARLFGPGQGGEMSVEDLLEAEWWGQDANAADECDEAGLDLDLQRSSEDENWKEQVMQAEVDGWLFWKRRAEHADIKLRRLAERPGIVLCAFSHCSAGRPGTDVAYRSTRTTREGGGVVCRLYVDPKAEAPRAGGNWSGHKPTIVLCIRSAMSWTDISHDASRQRARGGKASAARKGVVHAFAVRCPILT
eukprot:2907267-Rhodomonas_salina.2